MFDDYDIVWIISLSCLENCGLSIVEMKEFLQLCLLGKASIPQRQVLLQSKLIDLQSKLQEVQNSIDYIHQKQDFYQGVLEGKVEYFSNLISD